MFIFGLVIGAILMLAVVTVRVKMRTKCSWRDAAIIALGGGGPGAPDR
jgi:hypothetical protein